MTHRPECFQARKEADRLACVAWNQRMLRYWCPAQPSPALGDALNAIGQPSEFVTVGVLVSIPLAVGAFSLVRACFDQRRSEEYGSSAILLIGGWRLQRLPISGLASAIEIWGIPGTMMKNARLD